MTKRDFFRIIIKLFGLYFLIGSISNIFSYVSMYQYENIIDIISLLPTFVLIALLFLIFFILVLKSDSIINLLNLDKGYDNDKIVITNFSDSMIIKIALILIGSYLIIDTLPGFLTQCFYFFKGRVGASTISVEVNFPSLIGLGIRILIGYLLVSNYKSLGKFLTKDKKN